LKEKSLVHEVGKVCDGWNGVHVEPDELNLQEHLRKLSILKLGDLFLFFTLPQAVGDAVEDSQVVIIVIDDTLNRLSLVHPVKQSVFKLDVFDLLKLDFYIFHIDHGRVFCKYELDRAGDSNNVILNFSALGNGFAETRFHADIGFFLSYLAKLKFSREQGFSF
jgi:hypothetical protein